MDVIINGPCGDPPCGTISSGDNVTDLAGECPCVVADSLPGEVLCTNHTKTYLIHVYRVAGAPVSCGDYYTIQVSNGI